jgi:RimJ/RimL family protein N-acetyltransferase
LSKPDHPLVDYRPARPTDATAISGLYQLVYRPPEGCDPQSPYPFPQFLDPEWVADAVRQDGVCWIVADSGGELVGTVGALRNIGSWEDAVAEAFGLVVDPRARGQGVAAGTFDFLCRSLEDSSFIIAETRTAEPGGWRVVRRCGFVPMGFEPYAHFMPVGLESMLLTGKVSAAAAVRRLAPARTTERVRRLFRVVLPPDTPAPAVAPPHYGYSVEAAPDDRAVEVVRDDQAGRALLDSWPEGDCHASGVVCLRRLVGEDVTGRRYDRRYFVARPGGAEVGAVRVVWDRLDGRVRVLELRSRVDGLQGPLLAAVLRDVRSEAGPTGLVVVVDVLADHLPLQATLECLGFVPTVYYAGLVGGREGRADAVQYTLFLGRRLETSARNVTAMSWPEAGRVIEEVIGMASMSADPPTEPPAN